MSKRKFIESFEKKLSDEQEVFAQKVMNGENVAKGAVVYPSFQGKDAGFFQVGSTIVAQEGIMVLGSGWLERVVRSTPQFGVTLALFDVLNGLAVDYGWLAEGQ